jgi:hypothetical protein
MNHNGTLSYHLIKFLNAKNVRPAEVYRQVCEVYRTNATSDGIVRRWCKMFSEGRTNVHDDDRSGRPFLVTADLLDQVNEKIQENRRFAFFPLKINLYRQNDSAAMMR